MNEVDEVKRQRAWDTREHPVGGTVRRILQEVKHIIPRWALGADRMVYLEERIHPMVLQAYELGRRAEQHRVQACREVLERVEQEDEDHGLLSHAVEDPFLENDVREALALTQGEPWEDRVPGLPRELAAHVLEAVGAERELMKLVEECGELVASIARKGPVSDLYEEVVGVQQVLKVVEVWAVEELGMEPAALIRGHQREKFREHLRGLMDDA